MRQTKRTWSVVFGLLALAFTAQARAGFDGSDEELSRTIASRLGDLAFVADSFSKVEEGEKVPVDDAIAALDWLESAAEEAGERLAKSTGKPEAAEKLGRTASTAGRELEKYALDKSTPKLCANALHNAIAAGESVVDVLGSK